jgi:hypothetical protein
MITIKQIKKELEYGDTIIIHKTKIGKVVSNKCQCLGKNGYWIKWSGSHEDGTFYSLEETQIKEIKIIEISINDSVITDTVLSELIDKIIDFGIDLDETTMQLSWSFLA